MVCFLSISLGLYLTLSPSCIWTLNFHCLKSNVKSSGKLCWSSCLCIIRCRCAFLSLLLFYFLNQVTEAILEIQQTGYVFNVCIFYPNLIFFFFNSHHYLALFYHMTVTATGEGEGWCEVSLRHVNQPCHLLLWLARKRVMPSLTPREHGQFSVLDSWMAMTSSGFMISEQMLFLLCHSWTHNLRIFVHNML